MGRSFNRFDSSEENNGGVDGGRVRLKCSELNREHLRASPGASAWDLPPVSLLRLGDPRFLGGYLKQTWLNYVGEMAIGNCGYLPPRPAKPGELPRRLVLVPGMGSRAQVMKVLGDLLVEKGDRRIVYPEDFGNRLSTPFTPMYNTQDIDRSAQQVVECMESRDGGDWGIVTHSMGGLIAIEAIRMLPERIRARVKSLKMAAPPLQGAPVAYLGITTKACRQILPGSKYLEQLYRTDLRDIDVEVFVSMQDSLVPAENQVPPPPRLFRPRPRPRADSHTDLRPRPSSRPRSMIESRGGRFVGIPLENDVTVSLCYGYDHNDFIVGSRSAQFAEWLLE